MMKRAANLKLQRRKRSRRQDIKAKGNAAKHTRRERKLKRKVLKRPLEQSLEDEEENERA